MYNFNGIFFLFPIASGCTSPAVNILRPIPSHQDTSKRDVSLEDHNGNNRGNDIDRIEGLRETLHGRVSNVAIIASSALRKVKSEIADFWGSASERNSGTEVNVLLKEKAKYEKNGQSLGTEMLVAQGALWETSGDLAKAFYYYNMALSNEPNNLSAIASMARLKMREGKYSDASILFEKAIEQSPSDAALQNDLGLARAKAGDIRGALAAIGKAVELAPGKSRFANNLANIMFEEGDKSGAFATLSQNNSPAVANFNMAYLYFRGGDYALAKQHLKEVIRHEPESMRDLGSAQAVERSKEMLYRIDSEVSKLMQVKKNSDSYLENVFGVDNIANEFPTVKDSAPIKSPMLSRSIELDSSGDLKSNLSMP